MSRSGHLHWCRLDGNSRLNGRSSRHTSQQKEEEEEQEEEGVSVVVGGGGLLALGFLNAMFPTFLDISLRKSNEYIYEIC